MPSLSPALPRGKTELVPRFRAETGDYAVALDVSRDGRFCVVGLGDGSLVGLDLDSGANRFRVLAHAGGVLSVSVASDGTKIATGGQDGVAKLWTESGELIRELSAGKSAWVEHVAWAPAGERLATAAGRCLRVWGADGSLLLETEPLESTVTGLSWRSDGTGLAASCYGGVHLFPLIAGAKRRHLPWKGSLISVAFSPDAKIIACGSQDCSVHFWRLASGQDSEMSGYPFKPKSLAWDHESKLLATAGDSTVTVWDFRGKGPEGTRPLQLMAHQGVCTRLAFNPKRGTLASGSQDTSVLVWEPRKGTKPLGFAFAEDEVTCLAWAPRGDVLIGADASGTILAWHAP